MGVEVAAESFNKAPWWVFRQGAFCLCLWVATQRRGSTRTHHEHGSFPPLSPLRSNRDDSLFRRWSLYHRI